MCLPPGFGFRGSAILRRWDFGLRISIWALDNLDNVLRVNSHSLGSSKEKDHAIILWRAKILRLFEQIMGSIGKTNREWPKGPSLGQTLNLRNFHHRQYNGAFCQSQFKIFLCAAVKARRRS